MLADTLTLEAWGKICARAVADAEAGDPRAREWISARLLGDGALDLTGLAIRDLAAISGADETEAAAELLSTHFDGLFAQAETPLQLIILKRVRQVEAAQRQEAAQREERARAERAAIRAARKVAQAAGVDGDRQDAGA